MNNTEWLSAATRLQQDQQPFALVTVLRVQPPASARPGDKALVTQDGQIHGWIGGGCAQPAVVKTVRMALADGQPRAIRIAPAESTAERTLDDVLEFGMACHSGGTLELFIDPILPAAVLTIFGDSPVARALATLAPNIGLRVNVVAHETQPSVFTGAVQVIDRDDVETVCTTLPAGGFAVVATQGRRDLPALKAALALRPNHLWFVASARKAGVLKESLLASGEDPARVATIVAPAGEAIGATTPEEIALSVLAAVVAARRSNQVLQPERDSSSVPEQPAPVKSCCGGNKPAQNAKPAVAATPSSCCGG